MILRLLCDSQNVRWEVKNASRSRFWDLNDPPDMLIDLVLGQPWSSELETIDTTKPVDLGLTCEVVFMGLFYKIVYARVNDA